MSVFVHRDRLLCAAEAPDEGFWDRHWAAQDLARELDAARRGTWASRVTLGRLPPGGRVLEAGCGTGRNVAALEAAGYRAVGVDFAEETVARARAAAPGLDLRVGDVRALPFEDASFDGCWSVGVIEHFPDGYEPAASEMRRVLRPGGLLFLTFPRVSPLRRLKRLAGAYPPWSGDGFYQYLLETAAVQRDFEDLGFRCASRRGFDGLKGLKDEWAAARPALQRLYDGRGLAFSAARAALEPLLGSWAGHCSLLVLERLP